MLKFLLSILIYIILLLTTIFYIKEIVNDKTFNNFTDNLYYQTNI